MNSRSSATPPCGGIHVSRHIVAGGLDLWTVLIPRLNGFIELRGVMYRLRLVCFAAGWLASVDTVEGPTLGYDSSPYLAVSRAVEPIGGGLVDAMSIALSVRPAMRRSPPEPRELGGGAEPRDVRPVGIAAHLVEVAHVHA
jgi:hypothetical protein